MLNLFSRHYLPLKPFGGLTTGTKQRRPADAVSEDAARPDFDLSDFDDSPPTEPGGYWHEQMDDAVTVS